MDNRGWMMEGGRMEDRQPSSWLEDPIDLPECSFLVRCETEGTIGDDHIKERGVQGHLLHVSMYKLASASGYTSPWISAGAPGHW